MKATVKKIYLGDASDCDDIFVITKDEKSEYEWFFQTIQGELGGADSVDTLDGNEFSYDDLSEKMKKHYEIATDKIIEKRESLFSSNND